MKWKYYKIPYNNTTEDYHFIVKVQTNGTITDLNTMLVYARKRWIKAHEVAYELWDNPNKEEISEEDAFLELV